MDFTVPMALSDFVPVILFAVAAVLLQRMLYNKMSKGAFALFAAGTIDIICAGGLKALYKLLYASGVCDFTPLSQMFFPVQSIGFLLAGIGLLAMTVYPQGKHKVYAVAPVFFSGTFVFVALMCSGLAMMNVVLCILAVKVKKPWLIVLLVFSFVCSLGMGYLSSKDFAQASMNWIAEAVNTVGQGLFLVSALVLKKAKLEELDI